MVYKVLKNFGFVRGMLYLYIVSGFWLGFFVSFCREYLLYCDEMIVLEDEKFLEWECVYFVKKIGLSGGWCGFLIDYLFVDGDVCVFEFVEFKWFKIYIFCCDNCEGSEVEDGSVGGNVLDSDVLLKNKVSEDGDNNFFVVVMLSEFCFWKFDEEYGEEIDVFMEVCKSLKREVGVDVVYLLRLFKYRCVKEENNDSIYFIVIWSMRFK